MKRPPDDAGDGPQSALRRLFRQLVSRLNLHRLLVRPAGCAVLNAKKAKEKAGIENRTLFASLLEAVFGGDVLNPESQRAMPPTARTDITIRRPDTRWTHRHEPSFAGRLPMSRLADAEAKLEAALRQLEAALASRPAVEGNSGASHHGAVNSVAKGSDAKGSGELVDRAAIIAEIGRIDEQLTTAMQMIDRVRHASGGEGGTA